MVRFVEYNTMETDKDLCPKVHLDNQWQYLIDMLLQRYLNNI